MRILYVVHQFFPKHYTGTERFVLNLGKQMQRMGHSVKVLTYGITENEGLRQDGNFLIKDYDFQGVPVISIRYKIIPQDVSFTIFDKKMEKMLGKIFSNEEFDIIHVCHPMRVGSIIRVATHRNIPVVLTLTDFWLMCPRGIAVTLKGELCHTPEDGMKCVRECYGDFWKDKLIQRFNEANKVFQTVDCVVCATNFLKQIYEINNFSSNIKLIRFGKDYSNVRHNMREYSENSEITLGFLSTLLPHKGAHVFLEAFNRANMENIRIKVYGDYFGEIDYYNRLKKIVKENKKIEFCGKYKYEEIPDILDEIDVIVMPSLWWENSPLILLRALAHNVPAIVSDLGGMTEVVKDGENGFTFEAGSAESLAEVLRNVGTHPTLLNEMKSKIHHPPRIEEEAFEYEKIYLSLIARDSQELIVSTSDEIQDMYKAMWGDDFIFDIDERDEMYQFLVNHPSVKDSMGEYFHSGELMLTSLQEILKDIDLNFDQIGSFLDFACGCGRFNRFLIQKLGREKITVSDIDNNAVDFCKRTFGVNGFYSVDDPDRLIHGDRYDVIFVASLFSHLSLQLWSGWLNRLYGMLNEGGILIFSTQGMYSYNLLEGVIRNRVEKIEEGFYYLTESESKRLSTKDYGTTYVTRDYVEKVVRQNNLGKIVAYYPRKLWSFQDVYVIKKDTAKTSTTELMGD